jgi:hypothetical protein
MIFQYFGISFDERGRSVRIRDRMKDLSWSKPIFPLLAPKNWTRGHCKKWLKDKVPHKVPRSACVYCPFKSNEEWLHLKNTDKKGWIKSIEVDNALRSDVVLHRNEENKSMYLHNQCVPLDMVDLEKEVNKGKSLSNFGLLENECEGMCGV